MGYAENKKSLKGIITDITLGEEEEWRESSPLLRPMILENISNIFARTKVVCLDNLDPQSFAIEGEQEDLCHYLSMRVDVTRQKIKTSVRVAKRKRK
jgi:hypothetical protein